MIKVGDLVEFSWDGIDYSDTRVGIVIDIFSRPEDVIGNEFYVYSESIKWSVPAVWCKKIA